MFYRVKSKNTDVAKKTDKEDAHRQQELTAKDQEIRPFKIRAFM